MTKATTQGEKRRRKKAMRDAAPEAPALGRPRKDVAREASDRPQRPTAALRVTMLARARAAAIDLPVDGKGREVLSPETLHRLRQPWMGCAAGRAIEAQKPADRATCWQVITAVRKAYHRYWNVVGIPAPYPPAARFLYVPPPPEDSEDGSGETREFRTIEEDVKSATSAMMRCEIGLGPLRWAKACILFDEPVRDRDALIKCLLAMA